MLDVVSKQEILLYLLNYYLSAKIAVSNARLVIENHNLSLKVVFLFQRFLVNTVDKNSLIGIEFRGGKGVF